MLVDPEFSEVPTALHNALFTIPATKALCATEMIATHPLTLSQAQVEVAIDRIITDLTEQIILDTADYASLLAKHQASAPAAALREIQESGTLMLLEHEKAVSQAVIDGATSEWLALSQPQQDAIPNIKKAGDEGIVALASRIVAIDAQIQEINHLRNLGF